MSFFLSWKGLAAALDKSVSGAKRDVADDPDAPRKVQTGPNRVGFLNTHVEAYVELLYLRQLEREGFLVSKRMSELRAILHGDAFMDESAAGKKAERHREYARA